MSSNFIKLMFLILIAIFLPCILALFPEINIATVTILAVIFTLISQFLIFKINKKYDVFHPATLFAFFYCYSMVGNYFVETYFTSYIKSMVASENLDKTVFYCFCCLLAFLSSSLLTSLIFNSRKRKVYPYAEIKNKLPYKLTFPLTFRANPLFTRKKQALHLLIQITKGIFYKINSFWVVFTFFTQIKLEI